MNPDFRLRAEGLAYRVCLWSMAAAIEMFVPGLALAQAGFKKSYQPFRLTLSPPDGDPS